MTLFWDSPTTEARVGPESHGGVAGRPRELPREVGVTAPDGTLELMAIRGGRPLWMWPRIDWFDLSGRILRVEVDGYRARDVQLEEAVSSGPYRNPAARISVPLQRQ